MTYKEQLYNYKTIPSLNGWRAIAVALVVIGHLKTTIAPNQLTYKILDNLIFADFGVRIFFVLSGFLITTLLIKEKAKYGKINIRHFFIRRFLRIVPVLWLYLAVVALLNQLFKFNLTLSHFLGPLLYLNNFNFFPGVWLLGHTWSLAVEEQFYLIWPFLFAFSNKVINVALFFVIITPIIILVTYFKPTLSNMLLEPFLRPGVAIFTGALLSLVWNKNFFNFKVSVLLNHFGFYFTSAFCLIICILRHYGKVGLLLYPAGDTLLNLGIAYLITFSVINTNSKVFTFLNKNLMVKIGLLSYSIYIWQQLFIIPKGMLTNWTMYLAFPLNLIIAGGVAWLSYHYFEKPFLALKNKFSSI